MLQRKSKYGAAANERVFLGLGSNLGDRMANLQSAVDSLQDRGIQVVRASFCYETEPVDGPSDQDNYINAVVEITPSVEPSDTLAICKQIEIELGRLPGKRWGPRLIDIDILIWGDRVLREPDLFIPHPEMHRRAFVLIPLDEIASTVYNTSFGCTVHELALQLTEPLGVERLGEPYTLTYSSD